MHKAKLLRFIQHLLYVTTLFFLSTGSFWKASLIVVVVHLLTCRLFFRTFWSIIFLLVCLKMLRCCSEVVQTMTLSELNENIAGIKGQIFHPFSFLLKQLYCWFFCGHYATTIERTKTGINLENLD